MTPAEQMLQQLEQESMPSEAEETLRLLEADTKDDRTFLEGVIDTPKRMMQGIAEAYERRQAPEYREEIKKRDKGRALSLVKGFNVTADGAIQMSLDAAERIGAVQKGTTANFTAMSDADRKEFENYFKEEFGENADFVMGEVAGQIVPYILVGRAIPISGQAGIVKSTLQGTAVGGLFGAGEYIPADSEESRLMNILVGGGLGGAFSLAFNMLPGLKNFIKRKMNVKKDTAFVKEGLDLTKRTGTELKLSQIMDDPVAKELEKVATTSTSGQRLATALEDRQIGQSLNYWHKTAKRIVKGRKDFGEMLAKAFDRTLGSTQSGKGMLGARARQAAKDFAKVDTASKGKPVIEIKKFLSIIDDEIAIASSRGAKNPSIVRELNAIRDDFTQMPKATGLEMQRMLSKYGSAAKGSGKIFTDVIDKADDLRVSKRLFSALNSDLNQAAKAGTESGLALKDARDNYARLSKPIRQLEESALYRLFNGKVPKSNDELAAAVMTMKPDKLKGVMQILSKSDPALKARLQRFWVEQHIQKAMVTGEATVPRFNPVRMLKMRDTPQYNVIFNTPSERKAVETGIKLSQRIIMNNFNESGRVFERTKLAAGVLASRDKTFVARLAADLFAPKAIAKYVQSKQGIQVLTEMAKAKNTNAIAGAMEKLHYINQQDAE